MAEGSKPAWLFYHLQNEKGESSAHPNACKLFPGAGGRIRLQDVLDAFPLTGSGSFHFRFQVAQDNVVMFLDVVDPADPVPLVGGNVIAKVLRLDTLKTMSRQVYNLQPRRAAVSASQSLPGPSGSAARVAASGAMVSPRTAAPAERPRPVEGSGAQAAPSAAAVPQRAAAERPVARSAAPAPAAASVQRPPEMPWAPARDAAPAAGAGSGGAGAAVPQFKPVKAVADIGPVVVPDVVDADLEGKSDFVKAEVMKRRQALRDEQQRRITEASERDAAAKADQEALDGARSVHGARVKEWAEEGSGSRKNVRILLSTLQGVLWPDAKWEPVPMAKLIDPKRVKFYYLRACALVHPDKHNTMDSTQRFIATEVFHYMETAYSAFRDTELGGASG